MSGNPTRINAAGAPPANRKGPHAYAALGMGRRGFALTLSMIVLIFFITLILTVESQRAAIEEQTRSSHARVRAASALLSDMESPALNYSFEKMAKRSLHDLTMEVITKAGSGELDDPRKAYIESGESKKKFCESLSNNLNGYFESLKVRAADSGLNLEYDVSECEVELIDGFNAKVNVSFNVALSGQGISATKSINREAVFSIEGIYDPLLAVESYRASPATPETNMVFRPIIKSSITKDELQKRISQRRTVNAEYGQGWAYGEIMDVSNRQPRDIPVQERATKIALIEISKNPEALIWWADYLNDFRGVVLAGTINNEYDYGTTFAPGKNSLGVFCPFPMDYYTWEEDSPCINCGTYAELSAGSSPGDCQLDKTAALAALENQGFRHYSSGDNIYAYRPKSPADTDGYQDRKNILVNVPFVRIGRSAAQQVGDTDKLMINIFGMPSRWDYKDSDGKLLPVHVYGYDGAGLYNIEPLRGAVLCGNYFEWHREGPDIFSRLEGDLNARDDYGIETFVMGTWAMESYSKIDHEYYKKASGDKVMGIPRCITMEACEKRDDEASIGMFRISSGRDSDYGMSNLIVR